MIAKIISQWNIKKDIKLLKLHFLLLQTMMSNYMFFAMKKINGWVRIAIDNHSKKHLCEDQ